MRYVSDETLKTVPALNGLAESTRADAIQDAATILSYVQGNEWITDADLRTHFEGTIAITRFNRALQVLQETNQLHLMPEQPLPGVEIPEEEVNP